MQEALRVGHKHQLTPVLRYCSAQLSNLARGEFAHTLQAASLAHLFTDDSKLQTELVEKLTAGVTKVASNEHGSLSRDVAAIEQLQQCLKASRATLSSGSCALWQLRPAPVVGAPLGKILLISQEALRQLHDEQHHLQRKVPSCGATQQPNSAIPHAIHRLQSSHKCRHFVQCGSTDPLLCAFCLAEKYTKDRR